MNRRQFLVSCTAAGGLAVGGAFLVRRLRGASSAPTTETGTRPLTWLALTPHGDAELTIPISEMGQGSRTGIAQLVAEELELPLARMRVVTSQPSREYFVRESSFTGGSNSIMDLFDEWRRLGAAGRSLLIAAAAARWQVAPARCTAREGRVLHPDGRTSLGYGELAAEAALQQVPARLELKPREAWHTVGKPHPRLGLQSLVDGTARYGIDVRVPGAAVAAIVHCPQFGGTLASVDPSPAMRMRGVTHVVSLERAVAVVADHWWNASRALAALAPAWTPPPGPLLDDAMLGNEFETALRGEALQVRSGRGDADPESERRRARTALEAAHTVIERTYEGPLLAHATLEPQNATAAITSDGAEIWCPTQAQSAVRDDVAKALGIAPERVQVHTTLLGGGLGRRLESDYAVEAALVARAAGRPVQLVWSRAEDFQHDFYRPAVRCTIRAAVDAEGMPRLLHARTAATNDTVAGGLSARLYDLEPSVIECARIAAPVPIGAWRSVDGSIGGFFLESMIDELAIAAKVDPLEYRLRLLGAKPRGRRVLEAAARLAGYAPDRRDLGVALFTGWDTWVAQVVQVARAADGSVVVARVSCAFDCGTAVNPGLVRAQVEGGILLALSAALYEHVPMTAGRAGVANFDAYRLLRIAESPRIDVELLETPDVPVGGVGEPPVPPLAAAVANAIHRYTGQRIRRLPLAEQVRS